MRFRCWTWIVWLSVLAPALHAEDHEAQARTRMLAEIEADLRATKEYIGRDTLSPRVRAALASVPRHELVPEGVRAHAYANRPLPIGHGQTISQPYIVAIMTELLDLEPGDRVLEVGTGSGYQAAVLSKLVGEVFTVEIVQPLGLLARKRLGELGFDNVEVRLGDGYYGWPEHAPFDAIIVTAAASHVPPPLVDQLKPGGRMMIPVGSPFLTQQLVLVEKDDEGKPTTRQVLPVRFVPLTGGPAEP